MRAMRWWARAWPICVPARAWARARCGARRSCVNCGLTSILESIRGNVDTRLRKLDDGQFDAIVMAAAGLKRLGWEDRIAEILPPEIMCPAPGQGALAIETRIGENACAVLDHAPSRARVNAERAVLASLGGGCQVPIGAYARIESAILYLTAVVVSPDGRESVHEAGQGNPADAEAIGRGVGAALLDHGAREILDRVYAS